MREAILGMDFPLGPEFQGPRSILTPQFGRGGAARSRAPSSSVCPGHEDSPLGQCP